MHWNFFVNPILPDWLIPKTIIVGFPGHHTWWAVKGRDSISTTHYCQSSWNNHFEIWILWCDLAEGTGGQRLQRLWKEVYSTWMDEQQVRATTEREKWRVELHLLGWLCKFFFFFSFTLSLPWYSETGPSKCFNSQHADMGGRGVNHLFTFYSQGAFANKLPKPDGPVEVNGRKGCLL